jgi:hypothetical protein
MRRNRLVYAALLLALAAVSYVSGERLLYVAVLVFAVLPVVSFCAAFVMLRIMRVAQSIPTTVVKNEPNIFLLHMTQNAQIIAIFAKATNGIIQKWGILPIAKDIKGVIKAIEKPLQNPHIRTESIRNIFTKEPTTSWLKYVLKLNTPVR